MIPHYGEHFQVFCWHERQCQIYVGFKRDQPKNWSQDLSHFCVAIYCCSYDRDAVMYIYNIFLRMIRHDTHINM